MTRKRYIKLHMAAGVPRNLAAELARADREAGFPYAAGWGFFKAFQTPPPDIEDVEVVQTDEGIVLRWEVPV